MALEEKRLLMEEIRLALISNADTLLPKAQTIEIQPFSADRRLEFEIRVQYEVGVWKTYTLTLSEKLR